MIVFALWAVAIVILFAVFVIADDRHAQRSKREHADHVRRLKAAEQAATWWFERHPPHQPDNEEVTR